MKTKRVKMVLLAASAFVFAVHEAHAFYNPQQGRWINRDPATEQVGVTPYASLERRSNSIAFVEG